MNSETADFGMPEETQSPDIELEETRSFASDNLAEDMSDDELVALGEHCRSGFELDLDSRSQWETNLEEWTNLAKQLKEEKTYPWPKASNVKYPLLSTAAMQFAARAYPSLVPSNGKVVKSTVIGSDPDGQKFEQAERVSTYMSWQLMHEMQGWEEDMDKMLMMLPVVGTMFKKTWYNKSEDKICSTLILPKNIVINYWAKSVENAERISEVIEMTQRILKDRQRTKLFRDVDLGTPSLPLDQSGDAAPAADHTTPYQLVEQHTFYDIDDDGYDEPVIVTFERNTGIVLRVSRRYRLEDVELMEDEKTIKKIKPDLMYTKFGFVPNPDGSFYDIGFGVLLGPLNESVNTLINQLVDAGSLSNLQSGFIGKTLRLKMGDSKFAPGEWKPVNATGDDLRKQVVPLPAKEPSNVLLELMGTLVSSGKELASVAEIFTGKMPGQNTPATTTMASVEQGMKVFTAVYKRIFRALAEEFKKIYRLNSIYLDPNKYVAVLDENIGPDDFDLENYNVCPGADPTAMTSSEKLMKAQGLLELIQMAPGMLDPIQVVSRVLEAQEQPNWQQLFTQEVQQTGQLPPPPPDPKMMAIQAKAQVDQQKAAADLQFKQQEMELNSRDKQQQMLMREQEHAQKMAHQEQQAQLKAASDISMSRIFTAQAAAKGNQELVNKQQAHNQKMQQTKEVQKSTQKSESGKGPKGR